MQLQPHAAIGRGALLVLVSLFALIGCNNPFQVGLGDNVDIDRPDGEIRAPDAGNYLRGVVTLSGDHSDDTTSIPAVTLSFDGGASAVSATVTENEWTYELDTTSLPDGELEVLITITDDSGKSVDKRQLYYVDNSAPIVLVKNPQGYDTNRFNGTVTVRGEAADMFAIDEVHVQIQDTNGDALSSFDLAEGTNSWVFEFDSRMYADPAAALRIAVQATDRAGNTSTTLLHYDDVLEANGGQAVTVEDLRKILSGTDVTGVTVDKATLDSIRMDYVPVEIDNDLDKPTVSFVSPVNGRNLGGTVLVTGTAYDDDALARVEMRLDLNGDGDYDDVFDLNGDGTAGNDPFETEAEWVTLSGTVLWTQELNGDGELYQVEPGHDGQVSIQVRAVDINGLVGNTTEISIRFDDTIPRIEGLKVDDRTFYSGINVSGTFALNGDIRDDEAVDRVRISYDGGITYTDIFNRDTGTNDGSITVNAVNHLSLTKTIDTKNIPGIGELEAEPLYLRLLIVDNADYQTLSYVTLNVDNLYPTGSWDSGAADPGEIDGTSAQVQGVAEDSGAVSGIDAIHVYFVRSGAVYNLSTGATDPADSVVFDNGSGTLTTFDYAPTNAHRIAIDNENEFGDDAGGNGDGDGFDESLTLSGSTYTWWARFDSTVIPDGAIEVHYVVFDQAGNGTHYQEAGFIKNHRPTIDALTVGTDLDYSGSVEVDEQFPYSGVFSARKLLYVSIAATDNTGADPGIASYEVIRQDGSVLEQTTATGTIDISAYPESTGPTDDEPFTVRVTDNDGIVAETTFTILVDNDDTEAPSITIDPVTTTSVASAGGHVESAAESSFNNATPDADVSGTIDLTGDASDDQRIQRIIVQIAGFDAGSGSGAAHIVASWDAGTGQLVSNDANLTIDSQTLSTTSGHVVEFTYNWDTEAIDTIAATDVAVDFTVDDFGSPVNSANDAFTVDVVPYVTAISTEAKGIKDLIVRSSSGTYAVPQGVGSVIEVYGYNLAPGVGDVYISTDAAGTAGIDELTLGTKTDQAAAFAVDSDALTSGYFQVITNGILAINNTNDDGLTQNQEHSSFLNNELWTDDRFIRFFAVNDTGLNDAYFSTMMMDGDVPEYVYIDDSAAGDQLYRRGLGDGSADTGLLRGIGFVQSGFARDEGGHSYQVTLHDMTQGHMVFIFDDYTTDAGDGATQPFWSTYTGDFDRYNNNNALKLDDLDLDGTEKMNRYLRPKFAVTGNADTRANVALAWYDVVNSRIYARNFQVGTTVTNEQRSLAGGYVTNMPEDNDAAMTSRRWEVNDPNAGEGASSDFQIGFTDDSVLVVVYYDESGGTLKLQYSTTTDGGTTAEPLDGSDPTVAINFSDPVTVSSIYNGTYVSMDLETDGSTASDDAIHLAYYDSANADLRYSRLDSYTDTTPETVTVDANFSVGIWTDIGIHPVTGKPVISYYNNSENGTTDSIRLAVYTGGMTTIESGIDGSGNVTGSWENYTVPTNSVPQGGIPEFQKTHVGFDTAGNIIVSYLGDDLEYVRMVE